MRHFSYKSLFFLLLLAAVSCAPVQKIRLNTSAIPPDKVFSYRQTTTTTTTLKNSGESNSTQGKSIQDFNYKLIRKNVDGSCDWQVNMVRFQMTETQGDSVTFFDSSHPEKGKDTIKALIFKQLTSRSFQFTQLANGEISGMKGIDDIWIAVADSVEPSRREAFLTVSKQFDNNFLSDAIKNTWNFYPAKGVKKGKSWKKETTIPLFNANTKSTYWLDDVYTNEVSISYTSLTKGDPDKPGELKMGPAKINYFINGKGSGHISLDTKYGMVVNSTHDVVMQGKMEIKVPMLASRDIPITITTRIILERR